MKVRMCRQAFINTAEVSGSPTELDRYTYTYDNVGNRETATITGDDCIADSVNYGYDDFHRLTSATYSSDTSNEIFGYDLLGNRLTYNDRSGSITEYAHNCLNEYTDITPGANDPEYDAAGNLSRTETDYELAYDYENRLVEVKDPSDSVIATYTYDALGRRASQTKDGTTTRFYYDDENVIAEYDAGDNLQRYYVHGPMYVDEHVLMHDSLQGEFYYLLTALFSVTGLVNADGSVVERYTYDAYGLPTVTSPGGRSGRDLSGDLDGDGDIDGDDFAAFMATFALCDGAGGYNPGADYDADNCITFVDYQLWLQFYRGFVPPRSSNPYFFTGRRLDFDIRGGGYAPELALYHYRARAYDPWHGRFLQHDPALYRESLNLYQYAQSNPLMRLDPTGEWSFIELLTTTAMSTWMRASAFAASAGAGIKALANRIASLLSYRSFMTDLYLRASNTAGAAASRLQSLFQSVGRAAQNTRWPAPWEGRQVINGITYTTHALERMMPKGFLFDQIGHFASRGIPPSVVQNAIQFGVRLPGNKPGTVRFIYEGIVVITNEVGNVVITVMRASGGG